MFNKIVVAYIQKKWLKLIHNNLEIVRPTYSTVSAMDIVCKITNQINKSENAVIKLKTCLC